MKIELSWDPVSVINVASTVFLGFIVFLLIQFCAGRNPRKARQIGISLQFIGYICLAAALFAPATKIHGLLGEENIAFLSLSRINILFAHRLLLCILTLLGIATNAIILFSRRYPFGGESTSIPTGLFTAVFIWMDLHELKLKMDFEWGIYMMVAGLCIVIAGIILGGISLRIRQFAKTESSVQAPFSSKPPGLVSSTEEVCASHRKRHELPGAES